MITLVGSLWSPELSSRSTCSSATSTSPPYSRSFLPRIGMNCHHLQHRHNHLHHLSPPNHHHPGHLVLRKHQPLSPSLFVQFTILKTDIPPMQRRCKVPGLAHLPVEARRALAIPRFRLLYYSSYMAFSQSPEPRLASLTNALSFWSTGARFLVWPHFFGRVGFNWFLWPETCFHIILGGKHLPGFWRSAGLCWGGTPSGSQLPIWTRGVVSSFEPPSKPQSRLSCYLCHWCHLFVV